MLITFIPPARPSVETKIHIGSGVLGRIAEFTTNADFVVVLSDAGVNFIADDVAKNIRSPIRIEVPSGDASKSLAEADRIVTEMLDAGATRTTVLVCIGGGMLTDLGGFIASIFMRGIRCVLVPTTMLGMVDAAIGGKTAVNAGSRKNMIGTVTHPSEVLIDIDLLQKLPDTQLREGLVEAVKIAAIADATLFEWLETHLDSVLARDAAMMEECVTRAVQAKVRIAREDEQDQNRRLLLNFGHTVGHAVEALSHYTIAHGAAVSIGMVAEMKMLAVRGAERIGDLLRALDMPVDIPPAMKPEDLWAVMLSDKKNIGRTVRAAVPAGIGTGLVAEITEKQFKKLFT